jgi:regulator of nonsense transcripts 2
MPPKIPAPLPRPKQQQQQQKSSSPSATTTSAAKDGGGGPAAAPGSANNNNNNKKKIPGKNNNNIIISGEKCVAKNTDDEEKKKKKKKSTNATGTGAASGSVLSKDGGTNSNNSNNSKKNKKKLKEEISKPLTEEEKRFLREKMEEETRAMEQKSREEQQKKQMEEMERAYAKRKREQEVKAHVRERRKSLREKNATTREGEGEGEMKAKEKANEDRLRKMDSSIKKNVALVKKLKSAAITEATSKALKIDFESKINASKYMEECIIAIARGKLKGSDAFYAAEVIDAMFTQLFSKTPRTEMKEMLKKEILAIATPMSSAEAAQMALALENNNNNNSGSINSLAGGGGGLGVGVDGGEDNDNDDDEENKPPTPLLRRAKLCLLAELYLISIIDSPKCVYEVVKKHAEMEYDVAPEAYLQSLSALAFFAKTYSLEFLGKRDVKLSPPPSTTIAAEESEGKEGGDEMKEETSVDDVDDVVKCKPEVCEKFAQIIHEKYEKDALIKLAASVRLARAREEDVLRVLKTKGEVPAQVSSAFSKATETRDALLKQCQTLAEALRVDKIPKLEDFVDDKDANSKDKDKETNKIELDRGLKQRNAASENDALVGGANASEWESDEQRRFYLDLLPIKESIPAVLLVEKPTPENETDAEKKQREEKEAKDFKVDALINRLRRDCENAEKVDAFAVDFCYVATPGAKKRLAEELLSPPELTMNNNNNNNNNNNDNNNNNNATSMESNNNQLLMSPLVPFYARVCKLMSEVFPKDISDVVASKVLEKFFNLNKTTTLSTTSRAQSQLKLKQKLQNAHYVSELIKFELIDPSAEGMQCLQILIENFERVDSLNAAQNGAVELMCAFVRRCGRFLCKSAKSKKRANTFLDFILRLKSIVSKYLDETQLALVDEAYYAARPREIFRTTKPPKPVLFEYVKYLFVEQMSADPSLAKRQLAKVLKHCDQFDDGHLERYLVRRAIKHSQQKYDDAERVVRLICKLSQNQKQSKKNELIVKFADAALEEFRFGLEQNLSHMTQRRVSNARVIGELFNQRCLHAECVFSCLFLLLNTHAEPFDNDFDRKDPIRIRIANVLLEKCGRFFNRGWQKKKLDCFLTYFQRYMKSKILSMDVNNDAVNIIKELRPEMKICESFQEAHEMCVKMEEKFGVVSSTDAEKKNGGSSGGRLGTLAEDEEMEDDEEGGDTYDDEEDDDDDGESETLEGDYEEDDASSMSAGSSSPSDVSDDDEEESDGETDDDDESASSSSDDDDDDSFSSSLSDESSSDDEIEVRMQTVVASRQEESEFEREMEKFLGVGSVKVKRNTLNDENKKETAIPSPSVLKAPSSSAAQSIAFKMMCKGKDGKREKVDIALPETASFAMEAKKRQIMEAEELSEVRRLTLQRTADMQEEAISLERQNKEGGINSSSWRKKKSSAGDADEKDSFWNTHRRL